MSGMPFQGIASFLQAPGAGDPAAAGLPFAFMGLPYDCATSFRPGARLGPGAIRQASLMLTDGEHPEFDCDPCSLVADFGDAAITSVEQEAALAVVTGAVASLPEHSIPVLAGGDHLVTLGALRALRRKHGGALALVHFDAHCDTWPAHYGDRIGHGTWVRNAVEEGLVDALRTVQVGIRSPVDPATKAWLPGLGAKVIGAREAMRLGDRLSAEIAGHLEAGRPTFVSFDIDALDPAFAPGTGTPEMAGLTPICALAALEGLGGLPLAGMDVVEVSPPFDAAGITALAAATLLWTFIAVAGGFPRRH